MIDFHEILPPGCAKTNLNAATKKAALEAASELIAGANPDVTSRHLLEGLMARERLGSTGLGSGVAIPHCRLAECKTPMAAIVHLTAPVDFDAPDERGVDVMFVLAVPEDEESLHLEILATIARLFDHVPNLEVLRRADSDERLYEAVQTELAASQ